MAQSFGCPACGAPLDYAGDGASTIPCPYCYTSVIVPQELRRQRSEPVPHDVTQSLAGQAHKLRELSHLIRAKQRDQAINMYQQVYHVDMANAQQLIDQLMSGSQMVITSDMGGFGTSMTTVNFGGMPSTSSSSLPLAGGAPNTYTSQPQVVYTTTANQSKAGRYVMWAIGCFVAFMIITTVLTTVIPILFAVAVPLLALFLGS